MADEKAKKESKRTQAEWRVAATVALGEDETLSHWRECGLTPGDFEEDAVRTVLYAVEGVEADKRLGAAYEALISAGQDEAWGRLSAVVDNPTLSSPAYFPASVVALKRHIRLARKRELEWQIAQAKERGEDVADLERQYGAMLVAGDEWKAAETVKPYKILTVAELLKQPRKPRVDLIGEAIVSAGGLMSLVGPGGTGKTRIALQWAICSLAGVDFGPLKVEKYSGRWLMMIGNENSPDRVLRDVENIMAAMDFAPEVREDVLERLVIQTCDSPEDALSPVFEDRLRQTMIEARAGVCTLDPYGDLIGGDANSDSDNRKVIAAVARAARAASKEIGEDIAIIFIQHSKDGAESIKGATGWDRGAFGKGSKALKNCCRAMVNVVPADADGSGDVLFFCGKCNDAMEFEPFAMRFEAGAYAWNPDFDFDEWMRSLKKGAEGGVGRKRTADEDEVHGILARTLRYMTVEEVAKARGRDGTDRGTRRILERLVESGRAEKSDLEGEGRGRRFCTYRATLNEEIEDAPF